MSVLKVLVYSPNFHPELRARMKTFAISKYPNANMVIERVDNFINGSDLEQADAIIILLGKTEQIGTPYAEKGVLVSVFDPEFEAVSTPPEPPKITIEEVSAPGRTIDGSPLFISPMPEIPVIQVAQEGVAEPVRGRRRPR